MAVIESLPDELLLYIFLYLNRTDVFNIRSVSTRWKRLSFSSDLWRRLTMIDLDTDIEKLTWSAENIQIVKHCVRDLYISMFFKSGKHFLEKLLSSKLTDLRHLCIRESHYGNAETTDILALLAQDNIRLSSFALKFHTCAHLNEYCNIIASLRLRRLEINHGGSGLTGLFGLRHKCTNCSEERWIGGLSNLYTTQFRELRELSLGVNRVGDAALRQILNYCVHLESLELDKTDTTSDCFKDISRNDNLRILRLCFICIKDATLVDISKYARFLQSLELEGDLELVTDSGVQNLTIICKALHRIEFKNGLKQEPKISNLTLSSIASNCSSLKYLRLQTIKEITDTGFQVLVENCRNLVEISMLDCYNLTDVSLTALGKSCPMLRKVEFSGYITGYKNITNRGVQYLIKSLRFLEEATFASLANLRNIMLFEDLESLNANVSSNQTFQMGKKTECQQELRKNYSDHSHIRYLSFARCDALDDESLLQVLNYCPDLREVDLFNCIGISDNIWNSVFELCRFISSIKINGRIYNRER